MSKLAGFERHYAEVQLMTGLKLYALTTVILFFKMSAISIVQGRARTSAKAYANPEDAKFFGAAQPVAEEAPAVQRAARAWRNDLENIPIFLFLALIYVMANLPVLPATIYFSVFTVARIAHTICYLNAIQPARTIVYTIGALATLALAIHIIVGVILA
jgi:glutathione S-transferase